MWLAKIKWVYTGSLLWIHQPNLACSTSIFLEDHSLFHEMVQKSPPWLFLLKTQRLRTLASQMASNRKRNTTLKRMRNTLQGSLGLSQLGCYRYPYKSHDLGIQDSVSKDSRWRTWHRKRSIKMEIHRKVKPDISFQNVPNLNTWTRLHHSMHQLWV